MYQPIGDGAAKVARARFEARIAGGRESGQAIIERIMTEVPTDAIVRGSGIAVDGNIIDRGVGSFAGMLVDMPAEYRGEAQLECSDWALQQICSRNDVPWKYAQFLLQSDRLDWGGPVLANCLNESLGHDKKKKRYLTREYDGELRGFLSDRYRRMDSRPLVEAFANSCQEVGALPINGWGNQTKVGLTAVLPDLYEPAPNEVLSFGVTWQNSDYGNGKHDISAFVDRPWCANGMIMSLGFAQIHLGKRLDESLIISDKTHELDTATQASAIKDVVRAALNQEAVQTMCQVVHDANEKEIDVKAAIKGLKKQLTKGEAEMVTEKFNSPDVEMLPPGNTAWRLSNAISWVAGNQVDDAERQNDMQKLAGTVVATALGLTAVRTARRRA